MPAPRLTNFINGEFVPPVSGRYFENINPTTTQVVNLVPDSDERDTANAIAAARAAYPAWSKLTFKERAVYLELIAAEMKKEATFEELALADCRDMGKPVSVMKNLDMMGAVSHFETYSRLMQSYTTPYYQMADAVAFEHRDPIGVVGLITPWNFPLMLFCAKLAPALICGNCCVCKPSELSPTSANLLCKVLKKVGLPKGVVNLINGYGAKAAEPIVKSPYVPAISFTGGTVTGKRISSIAGPMLKKMQLELGGKNPAIVFDDCYLDETVAGVAASEFLNTGQVCCSGSRLLVQRSIAARFIEKLVAHVKQVYTGGIGDPLKETTVQGPLCSKQHFNKVVSYMNLIEKEGGNIVLGGKYGAGLGREFSTGYFVEPTIVTNLGTNTRCVKEEIFGPILSIHTFDTEEEAVQLANDTNYGLAASVWTSDIRRGQRIGRQLQAGSVWINCYLYQDERQPFGGYKESGVGRAGGKHCIDFFTEIKSIVSKL